jgi:hypothetical protein
LAKKWRKAKGESPRLEGVLSLVLIIGGSKKGYAGLEVAYPKVLDWVSLKAKNFLSFRAGELKNFFQPQVGGVNDH